MKNNITNNSYEMKDYTIKNLKNLGFYYNKKVSDNEKKCYSIRFPVVKYNTYASIEGEFTVDIDNGCVCINVYDLKGNYYAPFYNHEYGNYNDILKIINKNIDKQLKKYKIKKVPGRSIWTTK